MQSLNTTASQSSHIDSAPPHKKIHSQSPIIQVQNLYTAYGDHIVHNNISFDIYQGEIFGILGGSGSGKSTLLRTMILLNRPKSGTIKIFGEDIWRTKNPKDILTRCGVLFQFGALFSSLNVLENVGILLEEYSDYPQSSITEVAKYLIARVGLTERSYYLYPHELSGGMKKRVGLARALALNPEVLFLDEPSSGLDPASAQQLDELICQLQADMNMTIVMITHDLDSIRDTTNRFLMLKNGTIEFLGSLDELKIQIDTLSTDNLLFSKRGKNLWKDI